MAVQGWLERCPGCRCLDIEASKRMHKRRRQIGRLPAQVTDARCDHQHQLTAKCVASAMVIAIEDLTVKAMARGIGREVDIRVRYRSGRLRQQD